MLKKCLKSSGRNITINFYAIILYSIYYLLLFLLLYIYIYIYIYISGDIFYLFLVLTYNLWTSAVLLFKTLQCSADQMKILKDQSAETTLYVYICVYVYILYIHIIYI